MDDAQLMLAIIIIEAIKFQVHQSWLHWWDYSNFLQCVGGQGNSFTAVITDRADSVYKKEMLKS